MLFFAHTGITLGAALAGAQFLSSAASPAPSAGLNRLNRLMLASLQRLSHVADIRLLLLGSLLPDIIDKPLAMGLLNISLGSGRAFCHSLLFLLILAIGGWLVYRRRKSNWGLVIAFGVLVHLLLDSMWQTPQVLFWPLLGAQFPTGRVEFIPWITDMLNGLSANPTESWAEVLGFLIMLWAACAIWRSGNIERFLRTGRVG